LEADLAFSPGLGGKIVSFEHVDRAPSVYWQRGTWAVDAKLARVASAGVAGSTKDASGAPTARRITVATDLQELWAAVVASTVSVAAR
jgi:hypothetical protein